MIYALIRDLAAEGVPVALACRVLLVSRAGYYEWRNHEPSPRTVADAALMQTITAVHACSRATYGAPRVLPHCVGGAPSRAAPGAGDRLRAQARGATDACCGPDRRLPPPQAGRKTTACRARGPGAAPLQCRCSQQAVGHRHSPTAWEVPPPSTPPARARSTALPWSTSSAGWWWAGPSPSTCVPNWSWMPWRWLAGGAVHGPAPSSTPIEARSTPPGSSGTACAALACSARWDGLPPAWTTG